MQQNNSIIAVYCIPNLTLQERLKIVQRNLSPPEIFSLHPNDLGILVGQQRFTHTSTQHIEHHYNLFIRWLEQKGHEYIWYQSAEYPRLLREISDPPFLLTYIGDVSHPEPVISIVGTRNPSERARLSAFSLGLQCADSDTLVVSGFARGIDRLVHEGAVAARGRTWAILGGGLDVLYRGSSIMDRIISCGGAVLSEFHPNAAALRWHFPIRNRVIAGLSPTTVVVQAPIKSGALITADYALREGRDVLVHTEGLSGSAGAGSRKLAEDGADCITSLKDISEPLYTSYQSARELAIIHSIKAETYPFRCGTYRLKFIKGHTL